MRPLCHLATTSAWAGLLALMSVAPAHAAPTTASVTLQWTAPGDDGMLGGARLYLLRYSTAPITAGNFWWATNVPGLPRPLPAGSTELFRVTGLQPNTPYYFALKSIDDAGNWSALSNVLLVSGPSLDVDDRPTRLEFSTAWPNPARASVRCAYALPEPADVQVDVFDPAGRHVATPASGRHPAGRGEVVWDLRDRAGRRVPAGLYLVHARIAGQTWTRRVTVVQ